jgi:hypothetical protein
MRLYIAVLEEVPDHMVPVLVAHTMLNAHVVFQHNPDYQNWRMNSFKKCIISVNRKEFLRISNLPGTFLGHENKTLGGEKSCAIPLPMEDWGLPNVLKFAKLWAPACYEG